MSCKKAILSFSIITLLSSFSLAQEQNSQGNAVRAHIGFAKGAVNTGADYEMKVTPVRSWGAYFFYQSESLSAGVQNVILTGAMVPLHFLGKNRFDAYIAPGFGLGMHKIPYGGGNEITFGPTLKLGAEYRVNLKMSFGLQFANYYNWFSSKAMDSGNYSTGTATFIF